MHKIREEFKDFRITEDKIKDFKRRLFDRLNSKPVKNEGDIISLSELREILNFELEEYNNMFFINLKKTINIINTKQGFLNLFNHDEVFISSIIPTIKDNNCYLIINFCTLNGINLGSAQISFDYNKNIINGIEDYDNLSSVDRILVSNKKTFELYLNKLVDFNNYHQNLDYSWNDSKPTEDIYHVVDDGFLYSIISLNEIPKVSVTLSNSEDILISRIETNNGELYDYIDFYNDELLRKTAVNVNDLNPLYRKLVSKSLGLDKPRTLK